MRIGPALATLPKPNRKETTNAKTTEKNHLSNLPIKSPAKGVRSPIFPWYQDAGRFERTKDSKKNRDRGGIGEDEEQIAFSRMRIATSKRVGPAARPNAARPVTAVGIRLAANFTVIDGEQGGLDSDSSSSSSSEDMDVDQPFSSQLARKKTVFRKTQPPNSKFFG